MALLENIDEVIAQKQVLSVPCDRIRRNPRNPRRHFSKKALRDLVANIATDGQCMPILVRALPTGDHDYEIIGGERRWRACGMLNRPVDVLVKEIASLDHQLKLAVIENENRETLYPLDRARAMETLKNSSVILRYPKGDQLMRLGQIFGRSADWAIKQLALLRLRKELRKMISPRLPKTKRLSMSVAYRLSTLPRAEQLMMFEEITKKKLNMRSAQRMIDRTLVERGLTDHRRGRKPSDDFRSFARFAHRFGVEAEEVAKIPDSELKRMLELRTAGQITDLLKDLARANSACAKTRLRIVKIAGSLPRRASQPVSVHSNGNGKEARV